MKLLDWLRIKKYYYDLFLRPLPAVSQACLLWYKLRKKFFQIESPDTLVLGVTYRCQLDCKHCGIKGCAQPYETELTKEEIFKIISQAHKIGIYFIVFFGGEPFLRKDILDLIDYAVKKRMIAAVSTNGIMLTPDMVRRLKQKRISFLNVSIDSSDADLHNRLRQCEGCFQKTIKAIKECVKQDVSVIVSSCVTRESLDNSGIKDIIVLAKKLGAKGVRMLLPILSGKWLDCPEMRFSGNEKKFIYSLLDPGYVSIEGIRNKFLECNAVLKKLIYISPYGDVQPCGFVPLSFGNCREEPLKKIWAKMKESKFYEISHGADCPLRDNNFRKAYIDTIDKNQKLPIRIKD